MIELSENWKFKDVQDNVKAIKTQYEDILSSFLWHELKKRGEMLHSIRKQVFNYENIQYWQRERLWEVMNGDFGIDEFRRLCR